jgi:MoxR-like ATPase
MPEQMLTPAQQLEQFRSSFQAALAEMSKVIVGQERALETLLVTVLAGGHTLLTGPPGLGRTLLAKTLAQVLGLTFNRIQFTPDLLPSDIVGTEVLERGHSGERRFRFFKGPIFCNLLLADEINRSPARTQAALLEAMHERQVTLGGQLYRLPSPFLVIATRNSLETDGVWRMPEAQIDRFLASIELNYITEDEEVELLRRTTGTERAEVRTVLGPNELLAMQKLVTYVPVAPTIQHFALAIIRGSRPGAEVADDPAASIRLGGSPRAAQAILLGAKVFALVRGRCYVTSEDVLAMASPVLEHRLVLDMRASAAGLKPAAVVAELVQAARRRLVGVPALAGLVAPQDRLKPGLQRKH